MAGEFKDRVGFLKFKRAVASNTRYVRDAKVQEFLDAVCQTSRKDEHVRTIAAGTRLWRAVLGFSPRKKLVRIDDGSGMPLKIPVRLPHNKGRMKPQPKRAKEGRVNPKGIPVLYLTTDPETAIGEVRPWIGAYVSVGCFEVCQELKLADCTIEKPTPPIEEFLRLPTDEGAEDNSWRFINRAFSQPVTADDDVADYAPTQIIAEVFKMAGCDGVAYRSSLGGRGQNIALFDLHAADLTECQLYRVSGVKVTAQEDGDPVCY
jgi:hypothetical protein